MDHGRRAITIDEVPLEWCLQPAVKLDFTTFDAGYVVTADDVQAELDRIDHELAPLEIVVINTRAGKRYGHEDYMTRGCGMGDRREECRAGKEGVSRCRYRRSRDH